MNEEFDDVETFLDKWYELKETIANLEKTMDTYKAMAEKLMSKKKTNVLVNTHFILNKKEITRSSVSKGDLPAELWNQYSKRNTFNAFYIKKLQRERSRKKK
jgi:hypothetical protein